MADSEQIVTLVQNENLFYVVDEVSKQVFEEQLKLPFYCFSSDQQDCVRGLLKKTNVKVKVVPAKAAIKEVVKPILESWVDCLTKFKSPIKKKYEVSKDFSQITFVHLGPTAKTIAQKAVAIEKCQESLHPYLLRVWESLEPHFYKVSMLDSTVETVKHKQGTIIRISYPLLFLKGEDNVCEDGE